MDVANFSMTVFDNVTWANPTPDPTRRMLRHILWWYVLLASCCGLVLNTYCTIVLAKIRERHANFIMLTIALADICDLVLLLMPHVGFYLIPRAALFTPLFCKLHTFSMQTFSAYSTWCWVLLSIIRYLAVFQPYRHLRLQACSMKYGLIFAFTCCMAVEAWVPIFVTAEDGYCDYNKSLLSYSGFQLTNVVEITTSYMLPFACIAVTNMAVFSRIYVCGQSADLRRLRADSLAPKNGKHSCHSAAILSVSREKRLRQQRFNSLTRLIILVTVSLLLNMPNCVIRLLNTFNPAGEWLPPPYNDALQMISYSLSYTHYAINCVYLRLLVSGRKSTNNRNGYVHSMELSSKRMSTERKFSKISDEVM